MLDASLWKRGILRMDDPGRVFARNPELVFRLAGLAAGTGFALDSSLREAVAASVPLTASLSASKVRRGFSALLTGRDPAQAMKLCKEWGLLALHLPEADALAGTEQQPEFHPEGDVWTHTLLMLKHLFGADGILAWSVLLHDIGKPAVRTVEPSGRIRFFNHETAGGRMAEAICSRLEFPEEERRKIVDAVTRHMRMTGVAQMRPATVRKLVSDPEFPLLLELLRLDCAGCHGMFGDYLLLLKAKAEMLSAPPRPEPFLRGKDLAESGLLPSPRFGKLLRQAYALQTAGKIVSRTDALRWLCKTLGLPSNGTD